MIIEHLAYDTVADQYDLKIFTDGQTKQDFSKAFTLKRWIVEAGPKYFDETVTGVDRAIEEATKAVKAPNIHAHKNRPL